MRNASGGMARIHKAAELLLLERKYSKAASEEAEVKQATSRSLSPSDGGFVGNHEEPGVDSLAKQREVSE